MISIIVAIDRGGAIGRGGDMLYHIREDLRRFKEITLGNTVVMGRKTFESLPKGALPERRNIVVTRNPGFSAPGAERAASLEEALEMASEGPGETFIIGGGEIYSQALPHASKLYLTIIDAPSPEDATVFFPPIDPEEWQISDQTPGGIDPASGVPFSYTTLTRLGA